MEETACDNAKRIQVVQDNIRYHTFYITVEILSTVTWYSSLVMGKGTSQTSDGTLYETSLEQAYIQAQTSIQYLLQDMPLTSKKQSYMSCVTRKIQLTQAFVTVKLQSYGTMMHEQPTAGE
jgi:hypothetical protein